MDTTAQKDSPLDSDVKRHEIFLAPNVGIVELGSYMSEHANPIMPHLGTKLCRLPS